MRAWVGCRVEIRDKNDGIAFEDDDCDVRLERGEIIVSYFDDAGAIVFAGHERDDGGFDLVCRSRPRTAHLTWSEDHATLAGSWQETGDGGAWIISLGNPRS